MCINQKSVVDTSAAAAFLSDILPYLLVKQAQAKLAIELQSHKSFGRRLTDEVLARDEGYRARLLALREELRRAALSCSHTPQPLAG